MFMPMPEQRKDLSRDELIAVIVMLTEQVRQLTETVEQLQAEIERLKHPPASSHNSSQPPSRDWKTDTPPGQRIRKKKCGAQPGHAKAVRPLVEQPDQVIEARVTTCAGCGADTCTTVRCVSAVGHTRAGAPPPGDRTAGAEASGD